MNNGGQPPRSSAASPRISECIGVRCMVKHLQEGGSDKKKKNRLTKILV